MIRKLEELNNRLYKSHEDELEDLVRSEKLIETLFNIN